MFAIRVGKMPVEEHKHTSRLTEHPASAQQVCCVDLDGTLIAGDLFWEAAFRLVVARPWLLPLLFVWGAQGLAHLKRQVAARSIVDAARLPYRDEIVAHLRAMREAGHELVLATGSDERSARAVFDHLGIFTRMHASDGIRNLTSAKKAMLLEHAYGRGGFHYFGNESKDLEVWKRSSGATIVSGPRSLRARVEQYTPVMHVFGETSRLRAAWRALRPHQWAKNFLVFVPLITAHEILSVPLFGRALVAFVAFSACASAVYIVNDLVDLDADRQHPTKRRRPFAAGELSVPAGVVMAGTLLIVTAALAAATGTFFAGVLATYFVLTSLYSFWLKREAVVDVILLASLYVLRVYAGGAATMIEISDWLLAFALFVFVSLAFVKRCTELQATGHSAGRAYVAGDVLWMTPAGVCSGFVAVLVLALYISSPEVTVLYGQPRLLWLLCPILMYWITRTWLRASRGAVDSDPVLEALRDPASYACGVCGMLTLFAAL
jgi:4-hydroxybenzoate polyprenyltransferase